MQVEILDTFPYIWGQVKKTAFYVNLQFYILDGIPDGFLFWMAFYGFVFWMDFSEIGQNICRIISNLIFSVEHLFKILVYMSARLLVKSA